MGLFNRRRRPEAAPPPALLSYQVANLQGLGTRERQEDSFAFVNALDVTEIRRRGLLGLLADGMGGMNDGKLVSEHAVACMAEGFDALDRAGDLPGQLCGCVRRTAERLYERFGGDGGTTLVAAMIYQEKLYWASVGDSFLYLLRDGGLTRLNRDQNYRSELYLELIRSGALDRAEADRDPDGPRLTEFLGKPEVEEIDYSRRPLPLRSGDVLFLCSDGVGGVLEEETLRAILAGEPPAAACRRIEAAIRGMGRANQDNYTGLAVACGY